jgi:alkylation response protein AidB-like acyl-CoA dehydrogenase
VFVPERHTTFLVPLDKPGSAYRGPLYRFTSWAAIAALSSVATGVARAAIDDFIELAKAKSPAYTARPLKDRGIVQVQLARAEAALESARAYLYQSARDTWNMVEKGPTIDMPHKTRMQLAATNAVTAAAEAVDLIQAAAGTTGVREEHRFERHFRDVHTISQHGFISASRFESVGQLLLDVPVEWPFYGL